MSEFSILLESHIKRIGLAESQLAEVTGFSRSYIARLKNGQRISPDTEKMTKLFDALSMTVDEYKKLWNLYLEERLGKNKYDLNKNVLNFISSFEAVSKLQIDTRYNHQIPNIRLIKGSEDVGYIIKIIIEHEAAKEKGHLRLLMQPENDDAVAALKIGLKTNPNLKAEHLICLESRMEQRHDNYYNICLLKKLIPVVLHQKNIDYNIYYYYDRISAHLNKFSAMPYFIITNEYVVNIDYDCKNAILYKEQEIIEFYKNMFDGLIRECNTLIKPIYNKKNILSYYADMRVKSEESYHMGSQPCFGICEIKELIDKYAFEVQQEIIEKFKQMNENNRKALTDNGVKCISYFTKEGIKRFMQYGIIDELPSNTYIPLDMENRKSLIKNLIDMTEKGLCKLHLIDENKYSYPEGLIINSYDFETVAIYCSIVDIESSFLIEEKTLAKLFYDFFASFKDSTYVLSVEKTIEYLKSLIY